MYLLPLLWGGVILLGTALFGLVVHELSHALALRVAGVSCTVEFLPGRGNSGGVRPRVRGPLARVRPTRLPDDLSPWQLRMAAVMPLCLAAPVALALVGLVPDPFAVGDPVLELATVAWLGCAIPSPRDFSLLWYPERGIALYRETAGSIGRGRTD